METDVKLMNPLLQKSLGDIRLHYEELSTVLTCTEACLNSRPFTPMFSDSNDISVLTPGHFLIGDDFLSTPEYDLSIIPTNRLTKCRRVT